MSVLNISRIWVLETGRFRCSQYPLTGSRLFNSIVADGMKVVDHAVGGRVPTTSTRQARTVVASIGTSDLVNGVYKCSGKCSPVWSNSVGTDAFFSVTARLARKCPSFRQSLCRSLCRLGELRRHNRPCSVSGRRFHSVFTKRTHLHSLVECRRRLSAKP